MIHILIDVHNYLHSIPRYRKALSKNYGQALLELLHDLVEYQDWTQNHLILVLDGRAQENVQNLKGVDILFSGPDKTADCLIEKWVVQHPHKNGILVITSDFAIQRAALAEGGRFMSPEEFDRRIQCELEEEKPKDFTF
ncbi:MAG: NYN domain-containing protein [Chlamydiae bacterium]|nr:NYN domain-containing protein [Chlamydiota bacterium]MBI3267217.1 NYN domain-containing protein [Chlamydiota bacterium]